MIFTPWLRKLRRPCATSDRRDTFELEVRDARKLVGMSETYVSYLIIVNAKFVMWTVAINHVHRYPPNMVQYSMWGNSSKLDLRLVLNSDQEEIMKDALGWFKGQGYRVLVLTTSRHICYSPRDSIVALHILA